MYFGGQKPGPQKWEELWRNKEHFVHFRDVGGSAFLLKLCKRLSSFDSVVNAYLVICAADWKLGSCSSSHTALQVMRGVNPTLPHFKVCLFLVCPCFKRIFTLAKPLARNVPGTQQQTLHSHSMLPASVMREARQKDNNSGSFDVKTAIANKQPVITKNIFFEFKVSKLRFLYKAAIASGEDVLSRSKKTTPTVCLCSEDNSSLSFSYSAIKKKKKIPLHWIHRKVILSELL